MLKPKIDSCLIEFKQKQSEFNDIDNQLNKMQSSLDIKQNERWEVQKSLSDKKSMFDTAKKIINEKKINTNELNKSVIGARRELDNFLKQINLNNYQE